MDEKARIEKIMQAENMNSAQFALETGIQTSTLSHILNGRNKVSLKVLQQILNRFRTISSDWLFLGIGSMYRQEKHSQAPTLFDFDTESVSKSIASEPEDPPVYESRNKANQNKPEDFAETNVLANLNFSPVVEKPPRKIKRIIVYYDDNSFQEFKED